MISLLSSFWSATSTTTNTSGLPQHALDILTPGRPATARAISRALPGPAVITTYALMDPPEASRAAAPCTLYRGASRALPRDAAWRSAAGRSRRRHRCHVSSGRVRLRLPERAARRSHVSGSAVPLRHRRWLGQRDRLPNRPLLG